MRPGIGTHWFVVVVLIFHSSIALSQNIKLKAMLHTKYGTGHSLYNFTIPITDPDEKRRESVKEAFLFAYRSYKEKCWGHDELSSTGSCTDSLRAGLTIVDSLSTLYIMDLKDEFREAVDFVTNGIKPKGVWLSFEFVIRFVGGFLSAYQLSGEKVLLERAVQCADIIYKYRKVNGLFPPYIYLSLRAGRISGFCTGGLSSLADHGSFQLEFLALSASTGDIKYAEMALRGLRTIHKYNPDTIITRSVDKLTSFKGLGPGIDSFYEYLSKLYLISNGTFTDALRKHVDCIADIKNSLLFITCINKLIGIGESAGGSLKATMEHLAYFSGGMFIVGAVRGNENWKQDLEIGKELAITVFHLYNQTKTGLSAEESYFVSVRKLNLDSIEFPISRTIKKREFIINKPIYFLRPEGVETIYTAWKFTGDPKFREFNWKIFLSINGTLRNESGFFQAIDVDIEEPPLFGAMSSFFLAETLKYLYLTFDHSHKLDPNLFVFNTEAHPLKIWDQETVEKFKHILVLDT